MAIITWPSILKARSMSPHPRARSVSGGRSISGLEQRVTSDAGYWGLAVNTRERAAAYRWLITRLRAADDVVVPLCEPYKPVGARGGATTVTLAVGADLRATTLNLVAAGVDISVGHYLSIAGRFYMIDGVISGPSVPLLMNPVTTDSAFFDEPWSDSAAGSVVYSISIFPPLRGAASVGTPVTFDGLTMVCRLDDMSNGDLDLDLNRFGSPSLSLIEAF